MVPTPATRAHEQVKGLLKQRVGSVWPPGTQLPPIRQLAEQLGAGHNSTQRAVRELVDEGWLDSAPRRGTTVRGGAPSHALPLAGRNVHVYRCLNDAMILAADEPLRAHLSDMGAQINFVQSHGDDIAALLADAEPHEPIILVNQNRNTALPKGCAIVVLDTAVEHTPPADSGVDVVTVDSFQGGFLAGAHMRDIGCKTIAYLGVWNERQRNVMEPSTAARLAGFEAGWGRRVDPKHHLICNNYITHHGAARVQDWLSLDPKPQGIFAASDDLAVGFIHGARAHGLQPGVDYQIVGFDGQHCGRQAGSHALTTVEVPMAEMARHAVMLLADRMRQPAVPARRVTLSATLFAGDTTVAIH